jgi:hypothetical protein
MINDLKSSNLPIRASDNGLGSIEAIHIRPPDRHGPSFPLGLDRLPSGYFAMNLDVNDSTSSLAGMRI